MFRIIITFILGALVSHASAQLLPVRKGLKWGFINERGEVVVPIKYDAVQAFGDNNWVEIKLNGQTGLAHVSGKSFFLKGTDDVKVYNDSLFGYRQYQKWGVMDKNQSTILPPVWDDIAYTKFGQYVAYKADSQYLVSKSGKVLCPKGFQIIEPFRKDLYKAKAHDRNYIIDLGGNILYRSKICEVSYRYWPLVVEHFDGTYYGFEQTETNISIAAKWTSFSLVYGHFLQVENHLKSRLYNLKSGAFIDMPLHSKLIDTLNGHLLVEKWGKYGIVTKQAEWLLPAEFTSIAYANNAWLCRTKSSAYGVFSNEGSLLIDTAYTYISPAELNAWNIFRKNYMGLVAPNGIVVVPISRIIDIEVYRQRVKVLSSSGAVMYELDQNWNIVDQFRFRNVHTVRLQTYNGDLEPIAPAVNRNRFPGWFIDSTRRYGFRDIERQRIVLPPTFRWVFHYPLNRTLLVSRVQDILNDQSLVIEEAAFLDGYYILDERFGLADTRNGKYLVPSKYVKMDRVGLQDSNQFFVLGLTAEGLFEIITDNNEPPKKGYTYVDSLSCGMARVNEKGLLLVGDQKNHPKVVCTQKAFRKKYQLDYYEFLRRSDKKGKYIKIEQGKWGFVNAHGKETIPLKFDFVESFIDNLAIVTYEGKVGVINLAGEFVIEPKFQRIDRFTYKGKPYFRTFQRRPRYGFVDSTGLQTLHPNYLRAVPSHEGLMVVKVDSGWNYIDHMGAPLLDSSAEELQPFQGDMAAAYYNHQWYLLNKQGELQPNGFDQIVQYHDSYAWVRKEGLYYLVNQKGEIRNSRGYFYIQVAPNGTALCKTRFRWIMVKPNGQRINIPRIELTNGFSQNGIAAIKTHKGFGVLNQQGRLIIEPQYDKIEDFSEGFAFARLNGKVVLLDTTGRYRLLPEKTYNWGSMSEGKASLSYRGQYGYIDTSGQWAISPRFTQVEAFNDSIAIVYNGFKKYFLNHEGKLTYRCIGEIRQPFQNGIAILRVKGKDYYINTLGSTIFPNGFDKALPFDENGLARVIEDKKWGIINKQGQYVLHPRYFTIQPFSEGLAAVRIKGNYGLYDQNGTKLIDNAYENLDNTYQFVMRSLEKNEVAYYHLAKQQWIWQ